MWNSFKSKLVADIKKLEELNKNQTTSELVEQLCVAYGNLKILDAHVIAQEMLYAKK